ncbi:MAG: bifunctional glutamate N-acetyltransferase/amino-acid acetyltransferase ArgJ [Thermodesulfobacteriota bacterium]
MIHALAGAERNIKNVMEDDLEVKNRKLKVKSEESEIVYKVPGFKAGGISSGIKSDGVKDLALLYSEVPSNVVGVFTTNRVQASHIPLDKGRLQDGLAQAIIINSGCANACNGERGDEDARKMTFLVANALGIPEDMVLVASTGKIGMPLPMEKVESGIASVADRLNSDGWHDASEAIMTTDTVAKRILEKTVIGGKEVTLLGIAKGAGMVMPDMATMLAFLCTDACIERDALDNALKKAVEKSFNAITIDGDMSTNDTVLILANGMAENKLIKGKGLEEGDIGFESFCIILEKVCMELARMIVADGEGATKVLTLSVKGVKGCGKAKELAFAVANSLLVKTAFHGSDPNWGRMMSALGSAGFDFNQNKIDIYIDDIQIVGDGAGLAEEDKAKERLMKKNVDVTIDLKEGTDEFTVLTTDLSGEYVKINSEYAS